MRKPHLLSFRQHSQSSGNLSDGPVWVGWGNMQKHRLRIKIKFHFPQALNGSIYPRPNDREWEIWMQLRVMNFYCSRKALSTGHHTRGIWHQLQVKSCGFLRRLWTAECWGKSFAWFRKLKWHIFHGSILRKRRWNKGKMFFKEPEASSWQEASQCWSSCSRDRLKLQTPLH